MGKVVTHTRTIFSYIYSVNNGDKNEGKDVAACYPPLDGHDIIGISKQKTSHKYVKSNLFRNQF